VIIEILFMIWERSVSHGNYSDVIQVQDEETTDIEEETCEMAGIALFGNNRSGRRFRN